MRAFLHFCLALLIYCPTPYAEARPFPEIVDASLMLGEKGHLRIVIENKGPKPIKFIDAREGAATCAFIWTVEIRTEDGQELVPMMWYQPGDPPYEVTIEPGKSYERIIQPLAYVQHPKTRTGRAKVVIHYEVKGPFRSWKGLTPKDLQFSTRPLELDLSQLF